MATKKKNIQCDKCKRWFTKLPENKAGKVRCPCGGSSFFDKRLTEQFGAMFFVSGR